MSTTNSPYRGVPAQPCPRCRAALPPNSAYCANCGYSFPPMQENAASGSSQSASDASWSGQTPNAASNPAQFRGLLRGQSAFQSAQNQSNMPPVPPQSSNYINPAAQPGQAIPPPNAGNYYGAPGQPAQPGSFSNPASLTGLPAQPSQPGLLSNSGKFAGLGGQPAQPSQPGLLSNSGKFAGSGGQPTQIPHNAGVYNAPSQPGQPQNLNAGVYNTLPQPGQPQNLNAGVYNTLPQPGQPQNPTSLMGGAPAQPGQPPNFGAFYGSSPQGNFPPQAGGLTGMPAQVPNAEYYFAAPGMPQPLMGASPSPESASGFPPGDPGLPQTPEAELHSKKKSGSNVMRIVMVVALLVVLIGGGFVGYSVLHPTQPPFKPGRIILPKGTPLFADTFANNNKNWNLQGEYGLYSASLANSALVLEDDHNKLLPEFVPTSQAFDNFKLVVDAGLSKGDPSNGYGIIIRSQNLVSIYYRFELYGDGTYAVFKAGADANGKPTDTSLVPNTANVAVQKQGLTNHIELDANGSSMSLIVNGRTLTTISDTSYSSGVVALFVSNAPGANPGAQASFSKFAIYPAN